MQPIIKTALAVAAAALCASATAQSEAYKIGYLVDASGPMQGIFKPGLDGFQLYINSINSRRGGWS